MGSAPLVSIFVRNPASIDNNGCAFNFRGIVAVESIFERNLPSFVTIQRTQHVKAIRRLSIEVLGSWNKNFFAEVELTQQEVRLESMVNRVFFVRHPPPREVHLFPGRAVGEGHVEAVVTF